ncbi:MAG: nitrite reductase small subunit NirD [Gammaproteobacteria bacterium]|nr:nitrite reductase small subunit NirD [Gammaproteobacteria bacterium]
MTENWIEVGGLEDIPQLGSRIVQTSQGDIAIFRNSADEVFALRNRCPHKGGPLSEGIVSGRRVTCPLHNWVMEMESGSAVAPDVGCTPVYPVKVEGDSLFLSLQPSNDC